MIIRFSSSLPLITLKISLPSLDTSGKVKYQVRIYLIFLLKTNSGALQILSTSIQQEIKNVQDEYAVIVAESGLHASYNNNFLKTILNLFERS